MINDSLSLTIFVGNGRLVLDAGCLIICIYFILGLTLFILGRVQRSCAKGHGKVVKDTVFAIFTFLAGQADMANTILAGDGDSIFAVFASDANFAVDTVFAGNTIRASDRNAGLAVFSILAGDEEAVFAIITICTIMADDYGRAALCLNGDFAILTRCTRLALFTFFALLANGNLVVKGNLDSIVVYSSLDIAVFNNGFATGCIDGIALDGDSLTQVFLYRGAIFISQAETAFVFAGNFVDGIFQLAFRSGTVCNNIVFIPGLVVQTGDVIAGLRGFGLTAIRFCACNGLFPDGNLGVRVSTFAHRNLGEVRGIGHDDFQTVTCFIAANAQILGGCTGYSVFIQAALNGQGLIQLLGNFLTIVAHEFQAITQSSYGLRMAAILIGIDNACHIGPGKVFLTGLTVFSCLSFFRLDDGGAVSLLAVGSRKAISAGEANGAFLAVFAIRGILAQNKFILRGNRNLAIGLGQGNILAGIDCHGIARMNQGLCIAGHVTFGL